MTKTHTSENIDTTPHAGSNPEATKAWSRWAGRRLPMMRVLKAGGVLGPENREWRNVAEHSLVVNATAVFLAEQLRNAGAKIDVKLVDAATLLHDSTKRLGKEMRVGYAQEHSSSLRQDFLKQQDIPQAVIDLAEYTGRVDEMFIAEPTRRQAAIEQLPLENLVVAYADARIRNTDIVPLEQARDMNKQKVPADATVYDQWYDFYHDVETEIFSRLAETGLQPSDVSNASVTAMVQAA